MGVTFSQEAAKRIAEAVRRVERTPRDMAGEQTRSFPAETSFWAVLLGCDISGLKYSFNKVVPDPKSTMPQAFIMHETLRFGFDGEPVWEAAMECSGGRGLKPGTIVRLTFVGYDTNEDPVFMFSHPMMDPHMPMPPHDHRDNANGGFAFGIWHPGTMIPSMPWSM